MTPRERYFAVLGGARPDVLPRLPILMQFAAEHIGSFYGAFASDHRVLVEANLRCAEEFGIDQLNTMSDPYRETAGFGAPIEFPRDGVPICLKPPLEENPGLAKLPRPDPLRAPRMRDRIDAVRAYKERAGDRFSIMGWVEGPAAEAADLRGVSNFFIDLLDDPAYASALMARCVETAIEFARPQVGAGADTIGIGDAVASQVSAKVYESLILPQEQRLVAALHEMGARVRLHICGNIRHLLRAIATLGLDVIDIDHMVGLAEARLALGPRIVLAGNVDPVAVVLRGTPEVISAAVRRCYSEAGEPFMVNAGCEIPSSTPAANLRALCQPIAPA
ncbi:MAG TPA: uroporphyrinogen decarboxylase family protein [Opitutaceae bacterium]|nr:uroporphyrinogen decarboxylase family protein [Opitutaceae bacterium]